MSDHTSRPIDAVPGWQVRRRRRQPWNQRVWMLVAGLLCASSILLTGCSDDDDETRAPNATATDLANQAFTFANGEVFGIDPGQGPVTLVFGAFAGNRAPFRLEVGGQ